ncbi:regulatory protein FlaEY [Kordiimonas sediminis]|uniref:Regulatory protein FlaEY n=1 Tax=Kordiimonas sediminis TaxID=1735581 RepID=A0A919ALI3_9PROT|nr:hypothetical protein [Kordiimonas sediminis]GHF14194.1 regulatory protein FlaEY [Kordiimonas sediminis]
MAFFGTSGGLFGGGTSSPSIQIVGVGANLLSMAMSAKLTQAGYNSLSLADRQAINSGARLDSDPAVITPWEQVSETRTLNQKVREARALTNFIDLRDSFISGTEDPDKQATFAIYKALDNLRALAEYAADSKTSTSSLGRLDAQFQMGFGQVRDYISEVDLDKLALFMGDKEYTVDSTVRLGKDQTNFVGSAIMDNPDTAIAGLTGSEVFTVSITKFGVKEDIEVDLAGVAGDLTLNNIVDHINTQIQAIPQLDENGDIKLDGDGNPVSKYGTEFTVNRTADGKYGIAYTGTLLEEVGFSAAVMEPTLYVASTTSYLDEEYARTGRVTEINGLSGTLTVDNSFDFASTDLAATDIKERTADLDDDDLDPKLAALRDEMLADAKADVTGSDEADTSSVDENATSLTNIDSDVKVNADTETRRIVVDSEGSIYVVGQTAGSMDHQINTSEGGDVYLTKFDSEGNVQFSRLLGVGGEADVFGITVDSQDNVIITGQTDSALTADDVFDGKDAFVTKLTKRGDEVFTYQLDKIGDAAGLSVTVDANDDVIIGGYTRTAISATSGFGGGRDSLVLKLDGATGDLTSSAVIGAATNEEVKGIALASDGNILIATEEDGQAVIRKLDAADLSVELASYTLGDLGTGGSIEKMIVDGNDIYIAGLTNDASLGTNINGAAAGGYDGFVAKFTDGGGSVSYDYTTYLGTTGTDSIADVTVASGKLYVAGSTEDILAGEASTGLVDGFVARLDAATGAIEDQEQFGRSLARSEVSGVAFTEKGNSVLSTLGLPVGPAQTYQDRSVATQTSVREGDHFYISIDGGRKKKIEIQAGDTFDDLARRIRIAGGGKVKAEYSTTSEGQKLKISTLDGGPSVDLLAGEDGFDILKKIGITPGKLLPKEEVFGISDEEEEYSEETLGGVFGLKLEGALNLQDKTTAKYVLGLLDDAIGTIQRAYRSTIFDPVKASLLNQKPGLNSAPSPYMAARIANYTDALNRLTGYSQAGSSGGFF